MYKKPLISHRADSSLPFLLLMTKFVPSTIHMLKSNVMAFEVGPSRGD